MTNYYSDAELDTDLFEALKKKEIKMIKKMYDEKMEKTFEIDLKVMGNMIAIPALIGVYFNSIIAAAIVSFCFVVIYEFIILSDTTVFEEYEIKNKKNTLEMVYYIYLIVLFFGYLRAV